MNIYQKPFISNDDEYSAFLCAIGIINYNYMSPSAQKEYDKLSIDEIKYLKNHFRINDEEGE